MVAAYSTKVRDFYKSFWELVEDNVHLDLSEYVGKSTEYRMWRHVEGTCGHYGLSVHRWNGASSRADRHVGQLRRCGPDQQLPDNCVAVMQARWIRQPSRRIPHSP